MRLNELDDELMKLQATQKGLSVRELRLQRIVIITHLLQELKAQGDRITNRMKALTEEGEQHVRLLRGSHAD